MITAVRTQTFKNLQLNAGAFLVGFDYSTIKSLSALKTALATALADESKTLGATRGGGTFTAAPEARNIEADGKRYEFKGSTVFDSWSISMTGTLIEITPENMQRILATADVTGDASSGIKTIRVRTDVKDDDYLSSVVWVGDTSKGAMLIKLENALNTAGATLTITDKGEGTLPFEFYAHQSSVEDSEYAPFEIVYLDPAQSV